MSQRFLCWTLAAIVLLTIGQYLDRRLLVNLTPSLPYGLYWRMEEAPTVRRGLIYELTAPDAMVPFLSAKLGPLAPRAHLLKEVMGVPGDLVCWSWEEMSINNRQVFTRLPNQPLPPQVGCRRLGAEEVVVTGMHPDSCDSRYIGAIDMRRVLYRVVPVFTWSAS